MYKYYIFIFQQFTLGDPVAKTKINTLIFGQTVSALDDLDTRLQRSIFIYVQVMKGCSDSRKTLTVLSFASTDVL